VVDLVHWRSSTSNAFFQDLRAYLTAAANQAPLPKPKGPVVRLVKRMCAGLTIGVIITFLFGFALNILQLQNNLCSINFNQPNLSDLCGKYGLGSKPTEEERVAWEGREPGSCQALRDHIDQFGEAGALHGLAADLLEARRVTVEEAWVEDSQSNIFSQSITADAAPSEKEARDLALDDAQRQAEASCRAFSESDFYRFDQYELEPMEWECVEHSTGHYCGFDGENTCHLERLVRTQYEVCGPT